MNSACDVLPSRPHVAVSRTAILLLSLLASASCDPREGAPQGPEDVARRTVIPIGTELDAGIWLTSVNSTSPTLSDSPIAVQWARPYIRCSTSPGDTAIRFWTYQQHNDRSAYGVYAVGMAKNPIDILPPIDGDPVTYPGLSSIDALARIARASGSLAWSNDLIDKLNQHLCREGLRIVFILRGDSIPAAYQNASARCVLLTVELEQ